MLRLFIPVGEPNPWREASVSHCVLLQKHASQKSKGLHRIISRVVEQERFGRDSGDTKPPVPGKAAAVTIMRLSGIRKARSSEEAKLNTEMARSA